MRVAYTSPGSIALEFEDGLVVVLTEQQVWSAVLAHSGPEVQRALQEVAEPLLERQREFRETAARVEAPE